MFPPPRTVPVLFALVVACGPAPAPQIRTMPDLDDPPASEVLGGSQRLGSPRRPGDLTPEQMRAVTPRVTRLRADLDTLRVAVGDTVRLQEVLRIAVLDAGGVPLGVLATFDSRISGSAATLDGRSVVGNSPGAATLRISWPRSLWADRSDAPVGLVLPVVVAPEGASSPGRRLTDDLLNEPTGSGTADCAIQEDVQCEVRYRTTRHGRDSRQWLQVVVLQRVHPKDRSGGSRALTAAGGDPRQLMQREMTAMFERMAEAQARGREPVGGFGSLTRPPLVLIERSMWGDTIFVADAAYPTPPRLDSALVVMVDQRPDSPSARAVLTTRIAAPYPPGTYALRWSSGDTTFMVNPTRAESYLRELLRQDPIVAAFLR